MVAGQGLLHYYGPIERILKGVARRIRLFNALEVLLQLASVLILLLLAGLFIPFVKNALPYLPLAYSLIALTTMGLFLLMGLRRIFARLTLQQAAGIVERRFPDLKDCLTNALLLFREIGAFPSCGGVSEALVKAHLRKTADRIAEIAPGDVVDFRKTLHQFKLLIALSLTFLAVLFMDNRFLERSLAAIINPLSDLPARETIISLAPAPSIILRGSSFTVEARTGSHIPEGLSLEMRPESGSPAVFTMDPAGKGLFSRRFDAVQTSFRYQAFSGSARSQIHHLRVVEAPDIGRIKLTMTPPEYTGMPGETRDNGHIEAVKGTAVSLEATATKAIAEGNLILNEITRIPLNVSGENLKGSLLVLYPGAYLIKIRDSLGYENPSPVLYRINLLPDKYPEGSILNPSDNIEVSGNDVLTLTYAASDDFGLTEIALLYEKELTQRAIPLQRLKSGRTLGPEKYAWNLGELTLTPGERVTYRLAVTDNDAVSGPKTAYSRTLSFHVRDEKISASRESARTQAISDALLGLLADHLENVKDKKALSAELSAIMEKVDRHMEQTGTDKTEYYDLQSLKRNMKALKEDIPNLPGEKITQEMERLTLLAEDIVKEAGVREVEAVTGEIRTRQRLLMDAMQDRKGPLSQESLQGMLKELDKLKELTQQVMEALGRLAASLPDEFTNSPEMQNMNFMDLFKDIDAIRDKLTAGDLEGARATARMMLQNLLGMMEALAKAGARTNRGAFDRIQSEMSHQSGELDNILSEQNDILKNTAAIARRIKRLLEEETERRIKGYGKQLQELLDRIHALTPSEQREAVAAMKKFLENRQMDKLLQYARGMKEEIAGNGTARAVFAELMKLLESLFPDQRVAMTEDRREEIAALATRQKKLHEQTGGLGDKLEMLAQLFPGLDTEIIKRIKNAAAAMDGAYGKLRVADSYGAIPPEEEAIRNLTDSQQSMQQASRQMAMRMQANRWGYPLVYDRSGGWNYAPWQPLPTLPQPRVKQQKEQGFTGMGKEEFAPPGRDATRPPRHLREKVTEALKENIPPQYRSDVDRYFRGLTE